MSVRTCYEYYQPDYVSRPIIHHPLSRRPRYRPRRRVRPFFRGQQCAAREVERIPPALVLLPTVHEPEPLAAPEAVTGILQLFQNLNPFNPDRVARRDLVRALRHVEHAVEVLTRCPLRRGEVEKRSYIERIRRALEALEAMES